MLNKWQCISTQARTWHHMKIAWVVSSHPSQEKKPLCYPLSSMLGGHPSICMLWKQGLIPTMYQSQYFCSCGLYSPVQAFSTFYVAWVTSKIWRTETLESLHPPTIAGGSSSDTTTSTRCCIYSYMCSWWWVVSTPGTCTAVCSNKRTVHSRLMDNY